MVENAKIFLLINRKNYIKLMHIIKKEYREWGSSCIIWRLDSILEDVKYSQNVDMIGKVLDYYLHYLRMVDKTQDYYDGYIMVCMYIRFRDHFYFNDSFVDEEKQAIVETYKKWITKYRDKVNYKWHHYEPFLLKDIYP